MTLQTEEWKVGKRKPACALCARAFASEEEHYSGIIEEGGGFARRDFCAACWERHPELFSFWRTRMPRHDQRRLENIEAMTEFFKKLVATPAEEPARQKVAALTALLLLRRRRLKVAGRRAGFLRLEKTWDGETIEIPDPPIADAELQDLRARMEALFADEVGAA